MSANFGFVSHAAEGSAREVATHAASDRFSERCLADAGRSNEAEDRSLCIGSEFSDGKEFKDAIFDLFEAVMVRVKDFACLMKVEIIVRTCVPGQIDHPVEIGSDQMPIRGVLGQGGQAAEFTIGQDLRFLGEVKGFKAFA